MNTLQKDNAPPLEIVVWTDFVCPYCLIADSILEKAIAGLNVEVVWKAFELRPYPTATLRPEDDYLPTVWKKHVYPTAKLYGVTMKLPTISPQPYTKLAFIGMRYAAEHGVANEYVLAVLKAFFQQDRDIGKIEVLEDIAVSLGLNGADFKESLSNKTLVEQHELELIEANKIGIRSVPSMLLNGQFRSLIRDPQELRKTFINLLK